MMLIIFLFGVFLVCIAMLWTEGLWGNVIMLCNVFIAAVLATGLYEPLASTLDKQLPSYTFLWDFISLWLLFAIIAGILRAITDYLSKWKLRFNKPIESVGNMVFAVLVGMLMVCFTSFSLHMAPLSRAPFGNVSIEPPFGLLTARPGVMWLQGMAFVSRGSLSTMRPNPFDPNHQFVSYYANRRAQLEKLEGFRVDR